MAAVAAALGHAESHRGDWIGRLADLVSIPSVSSERRRRTAVRRAGAWLVRELRRIGLRDAGLVETPGHPVVYATWSCSRAAPTLLIYGHYDVVPAEPLEQWSTPPFSPALRGRYLHGRGASDDKGPLLCHLAAIEAWMAETGRLPINVRCVFEGEEEIGSPHLPPVLRRLARSGVDAAVISDTRMLARDRPTLIIGLRGSLAAELEVRGPERDLHSGAFGGAVHNPAQILCELVASLHDEHGRVAVRGFYRRVRSRPLREAAVSEAERAASEAVLSAAGEPWAFGERGYTPYEQTTLRPALDVSGLYAGHTRAGVRSIIPSRARAKLTLRLAPDQDPHEIGRLLRAHLARHAPPSARIMMSESKRARPVSIDPSSPPLRAATRALRAGFGNAPALLCSGGTIPVVELAANLGADGAEVPAPGGLERGAAVRA